MIDIFIAYSHEDLSFKNELKKFLRPMLRDERISIWDDFDIEAGQDWDAKIKERLYGADIILLLVSSDSLASDYFYGKEVKVSLERHAKGEAVVVPVILRHCDWENTPLGGLEALPEKGRPVLDWPTHDQAWQDTVSRLRRVVESLEKQRKTATEHGEALRAFKAAWDAAEHLFSSQKWREARVAYSDASAAHRPGFLPEKSRLAQRIAECDQNLRTEADEEKRRQRMEKQADTNGNPQRRLLLGGIGGAAALLIIVWLALRPGTTDSPAETTLQKTETPEQLESAAYQKAVTVNTIPALESYLQLYPAAKNAAQARQQLQNLQSQFKNFLDDADLLASDAPAAACGYLQKALALSPGNADVLKKLDKLKCREM